MGDNYPAIEEDYDTTSCPTQITADGAGEYVLPQPAIGPDREEAECNCASARKGEGCEAVDGGLLGSILNEKLQASLANSGEEELQCDGPYSVRARALCFHSVLSPCAFTVCFHSVLCYHCVVAARQQALEDVQRVRHQAEVHRARPLALVRGRDDPHHLPRA